MLKSNRFSKSNLPNDNDDQSDSDSSLGKEQDLLLSSSSSSTSSPTTTSKSSPIGSLEPKKIFLKKLPPKENSLKFDEELKLNSSTDTDPLRGGLRRPLNPIAKADKRITTTGDSLESTIPEKKDETPFSTMKFGSDTLDEDQEKKAFFRDFEQNKDKSELDYGILNQQFDVDTSPTRNAAAMNSFDKQINQMSTPLHPPPDDHLVKESLTNELDREIEHEMQNLNTTTTTKHVTIVEPPARPAASVDDFSRTNKSVSDCLSSTTETTRDLHMLQKAYKQNLNSAPTTRTSRTYTFDPQKRTQPQKTTVTKTTSKPNIQTPTKKGSPSPVARSKPTPPKESEKKDAALIEQLKIDKETLTQRIEALQAAHDEQLRSIRQEKYLLQTEIAHLTNSEGKKEVLTPKQRELHELEKLLEGSQQENEKLCKQIKYLEQQQKQHQQSMFDENDKLRQELIQTKMLLEQQQQQQISSASNIKKQPSTIVLTDLVGQDHLNENERLKHEIILLKDKLYVAENREDKTFEQKRIQDLERQVKELEIINRRRQHNPTTQVGLMLNPSEDRKQLEMRLIEAEQAVHDRQNSEDKLRHELNVLEEKYALMKQIYTGKKTPSTSNEQFERQLHEILNQNKNLAGQAQLRRENERLKAELKNQQQQPKPAKSLKRDLETIKLLRTDLERKNDQLEKLRALYDAVTVQHKSLVAEREREKTRLAMMGSKPYQPDRFTQMSTPIETVHEENQQLKQLVEKLEQDAQQQQTELMRLREDRQTSINAALRQKDEEISRLRQQHKSELQTVINEMSSNTSETRISDLLRKIQSQDATILQLKKLTEQNEENARELAILRVQDDELKSTVNRLEQELADARTYHTPEMKHFQDLQNKIQQLEQRWSKRDQITKEYTNSVIKQHDLDANQDIHRLRAIIKQKNQEIERFHLELDSMLELLKTLKFQQLLYQR